MLYSLQNICLFDWQERYVDSHSRFEHQADFVIEMRILMVGLDAAGKTTIL